MGGQFIQGRKAHNDEREKMGYAKLNSREYLSSGHFISSFSENMESEFLQMAIFVLITIKLHQKGSSESNKLPEQKNAEDLLIERKEKEYCRRKRKEKPFLWRLYENSLSMTLVVLFLFFFLFHAYGSMRLMNLEKMAQQESIIKFWDVFLENEFWFESFQNWQSEFFSMATLILLSIVLRQKGSSQSKKMHDAHEKTGEP